MGRRRWRRGIHSTFGGGLGEGDGEWVEERGSVLLALSSSRPTRVGGSVGRSVGSPPAVPPTQRAAGGEADGGRTQAQLTQASTQEEHSPPPLPLEARRTPTPPKRMREGIGGGREF